MVHEAEYHSGGILEISADGETWFDLKDYIKSGGYTGTIDAGAQNPLAGRMAWVGSSDSGPDNSSPGRADAMHQVQVNLGGAIQDADFFGVTSLPGARVRFRLGGTFQVLIGGIQGTGWGVDDLTITNVLQAQPCNSCETCVGDLNADGFIDGRDVRVFTVCALGGGCALPACADFDGDGVIDLSDLAPFVDKLVNDDDNVCP
jgi:hypothetical protein